jgi:thiol-disulfide isomerase/thioredoxin
MLAINSQFNTTTMIKYLALIYLFVFSCSNSNKASQANFYATDSLYVYISSENSSNLSYWQIQYGDTIGNRFPYFIKDSTAVLSIPFPLKSIVTIQNPYFKKRDEILAYPGDTIYVNSNNNRSVTISSNRGRYFSYNTFIDSFYDKHRFLIGSFNQFNDMIYEKSFIAQNIFSSRLKKNLSIETKNRILDSLISFNEAVYAKQKAFLESLSIQKLITSDYKYWIGEKLFYYLLGQQHKYLIDHQLNYYSYIKEHHFANDSLVWTYFYDYRVFLETVFLQSVVSDGNITKFPSGVSRYKEAYDKSKFYINGKSLEYVKFHCLRNIKNEGTKEDFDTALVTFNADSVYQKYINNNLKFGIDILDNSSETFLLDTAKHMITLKELLKRNEGYVLYIDLWASWCQPCRIMLPNSIQKSRLIDNKKIKFIYFSIEDDFNKWKNAALTERIASPDKSFLIVNPKIAPFLKRINIQSIPRYVVVANNKTVIENAPDPGDAGLIELLNKQLLKN